MLRKLAHKPRSSAQRPIAPPKEDAPLPIRGRQKGTHRDAKDEIAPNKGALCSLAERLPATWTRVLQALRGASRPATNDVLQHASWKPETRDPNDYRRRREVSTRFQGRASITTALPPPQHTGERARRHAPLVGSDAEVEVISVENNHHVLQQHLMLIGGYSQVSGRGVNLRPQKIPNNNTFQGTCIKQAARCT